ncbi:T9SS type A sorting domain-containing protein [Polaribacter sp.]|nr:T9SS type A sorting domain-containing protein [Polaribacter sp.]
MKRISYLMLCILLTNVAWSQDLHVDSGASITTASGSVLFVGSNTSVDGSGSLTTNSDAAASGSFIVSGTTTGNITYKRYINDDNWHLVAAPVADQDISVFVGDGVNAVAQSGTTSNYGVSYYNNTNASGNRWIYHNDTPTLENQETLTNFITGQGYSMKRSAAGDYTFTGAMADTDVSVPIPTIGGSTHLWSAIGNPFPSFLTVSEISAANPNALDAGAFAFLYVWNGTSYAPESLTSSLQLAPGQAFMVRARSNGLSFVFSKTLQKHNSGTATFYRPSTATPTISIHLTKGTSSKSANLEFLDSATGGLDVGYDAGAYQDGTPSFSIYTHLVSDSQGIDFTRQSLPISSLDSKVSIPLSINAGIDEEVTFRADTNNVPDGISVYLEDTLNNTFTNLTEAPLKIKITEALSGIGRFYLRTTSGVLSVEDSLVGALINVYKTSNGTVKVTGLTSGSAATFSLFTILGKEVLATKFIAKNVQEILLPASLSTGVYLVNIVSDLGTFHKKIVIE